MTADGSDDAASGDEAVGETTPDGRDVDDTTVDAARDLLVDLVATPSPSGEEDACADRLVEFFASRGREAFVDGAGNVRAPGDDAVLLTSHLDTVPGEIPVGVEDGELRGRGSVDAKGPLAAMAAAAARTGVAFAGVVGEESDSRGARHLLADREPPAAVVDGEPAGWDAVTLGYRGLVRCTYRATTPAAHSSRPEPNAVQLAIRWWSRVADATEGLVDGAGAEWDDDGDDASTDAGGSGPTDGDGSGVFERATATPVRFEGGPDDDGLSVAATVDAEFRLPPGVGAGEVQAFAGRAAREAPGTTGEGSGGASPDGGDVPVARTTVEWGRTVPAHRGDPRSPAAGALRAAIRAAGGTPRHVRKSGTSDANLYAEGWDCPVATYGPGDASLSHAPDERLDLRDFDRAVEVLTGAATRLRGG